MECKVKKNSCKPIMVHSVPTTKLISHLLYSHEAEYNKLIIKPSCEPHFDSQFNEKKECITTCKICSYVLKLDKIIEHFTNEHLSEFKKEKKQLFILRIINIDYYFCLLCDLIVYKSKSSIRNHFKISHFFALGEPKKQFRLFKDFAKVITRRDPNNLVKLTNHIISPKQLHDPILNNLCDNDILGNCQIRVIYKKFGFPIIPYDDNTITNSVHFCTQGSVCYKSFRRKIDLFVHNQISHAKSGDLRSWKCPFFTKCNFSICEDILFTHDEWEIYYDKLNVAQEHRNFIIQ